VGGGGKQGLRKAHLWAKVGKNPMGSVFFKNQGGTPLPDQVTRTGGVSGGGRAKEDKG